MLTMAMHAATNTRPPPDELLVQIADYATAATIESALAYETARYCLLDSLSCALLALHYPDCRRLLGPIVPGTTVPNGARVPGTAFVLDPVKAAFDIGTLIRYLDFNDTWLAAEWGHPSDNLGGILALTDYLSRSRVAQGQAALDLRTVLTAAIKAHEIQGILALENSFNRVGLDHVVLVKVATTAVATALLGGTAAQVIDAVSNAWIDGQSLRTYRHAPNTGARKSWAAGDATSRGVRLALLTLGGEMGYPSALSAPRWGFNDVLFKGQPLKLARPFGTYVMEHVLFKISFPAEFHAQTAVECALALHPQVRDRLDAIARIEVTTHESALRIIDKRGPLYNYADRDHCLQYMIAVPLLFGRLTADDYSDTVAADPRIDLLREKMTVRENPEYSRDYLDPEKRAIANAVRVVFADGSATATVEVAYPIGHQRRRAEGLPLLVQKAAAAFAPWYDPAQCDRILALFADQRQLEATPVHELMATLAHPQ